jgi:PST family polysaccharide transporter
MAPPDKASAARSAKWSVAENGGLALISLGSLVVYAHFLSVPQFGVFSIALAVTELLGVMLGMLFHDALVQRPGVRELHYDSAFTFALGLSCALAAACALAGPELLRRAGAPEAGRVLAWLALCLPLSAASATLEARRRRQLEFRILAARSLVGRGAGAAAGIALVVAGFGLWGLVAQQLVYVLLASAILWAGSADRPRLRFARREFRELIGFGLKSASAWLLNFCIRRAFVVVAGLSLGMHGAGLLNLSFRAVDTLWGLASSCVSQIALPVLASLQSDMARLRRAYQSAAALACVPMYFGFVLLAAASRDVVALLFGPQWSETAPYVTVLALQMLVQGRRLLFTPALTALGRPQDLLLAQAVELALVAAALALLGVPSVGWAIGIWVARELAGTAVEAWRLRRSAALGMRELLHGTWVPLAAGVAAFAAIRGAEDLLRDAGSALRLAVLAALGGAVYFCCVALLQRGLLLELAEFVRSAFRRPQLP